MEYQKDLEHQKALEPHSIEEQRGEGLSKNGEEEGEDALFVAGGGEFEGAGEEFAEKLAF